MGEPAGPPLWAGRCGGGGSRTPKGADGGGILAEEWGTGESGPDNGDSTLEPIRHPGRSPKTQMFLFHAAARGLGERHRHPAVMMGPQTELQNWGSGTLHPTPQRDMLTGDTQREKPCSWATRGRMENTAS